MRISSRKSTSHHGLATSTKQDAGDHVGSFARYQILMALWASKGKGITHKDIVAAMGVRRATVSGLMAALEREGW